MFLKNVYLSIEIVFVLCCLFLVKVKNYGSIYLCSVFLKNCTCIYSVAIVHTSLGYYQINIRKLFYVVSLVGNWNRILYLPGTGNINFEPCPASGRKKRATLFLTRFRTYKIALPSQTKMTSKDDIKGTQA